MEIDHLLLENKVLLKEVTKILSGLVLDKETLARVRTVFNKEMALGLQYGLEKVDIKNPAKILMIFQSSVQMETTYVTQLLDGSETGKYLALDLGSTNFR